MGRRNFKVGVLLAGLAVGAIWLARPARARDLQRPVEIDSAAGRILLYQPQPESFANDKLTAHAAVSMQHTGETTATFNAVWIEARVSTDRDARPVTVLDVRVPDVKVPGATAQQRSSLTLALQEELPRQRHTFSLDCLLTTLDQALKTDGAHDLQNEPPQSVFVKEPTVLVTIDGTPKLRAIEGSSLMRAVNTPFVVLLDPANTKYYIEAGDRWVWSDKIEGPWVDELHPPKELTSALPPHTVESSANLPANVPAPKDDHNARVVLVTEPTELLVSKGELRWIPVQGKELLTLSNSDNDVFMELGTQRMFVLLSGRWYTSASLEKGPWTYVPSDKLPIAFTHNPHNTKDRADERERRDSARIAAAHTLARLHAARNPHEHSQSR